MKLSSIHLVNNKNYSSTQKTNKLEKAKNYQSTNSIASNTLQEAIGRSQVAFKGAGQMNKKGVFEYRNFSNKASEEIDYNPTTGEFTYVETNKSKNIARTTIKFTPVKQQTKRIDENKDGTTTTTTENPKGKVVETTDSNNNQIFLEVTNKSGKQTTITDYKRGRIIISTEVPEREKDVTVLDLYTKQEISKGKLVEDWVQENENTKALVNIVTGDVYQRVVTEKDKTTTTFYSKETGKKTKEEVVLKGATITSKFDKNEIRTEKEIIGKDGSRTTILYEADGKTEKSKIKEEYDENGDLIKQTTYNPNQTTIKTVVEFDLDKDRTITHQYKAEPNVKEKTLIEKNGVLVEEILYYKDGETKKKTTIFKENSYCVTLYNNKTLGNKPTEKNYYRRSDDKVIKMEIIDQATLRATAIAYPDPEGDGWIIEHRDSVATKAKNSSEGLLLERDYVRNFDTKDEQIYKRVLYYRNGQESSISTLQEDGTWEEKNYDIKGNFRYTRILNPNETPDEKVIWYHPNGVVAKNGKAQPSAIATINPDGTYTRVSYGPNGNRKGQSIIDSNFNPLY